MTGRGPLGMAPALGALAAVGLVAAGLAAGWALRGAAPQPGSAAAAAPRSGARGLHLATNLEGDFERLVETGFNLADVGSVAALDGLPPGLRGVLWVGNGYNSECRWRLSDAEIEAAVAAARDHPAFGGIYYLADEPHPATCPDAARAVAERSALVKRLDPDARTFIVVQNGAADPGEFAALADAADLIGVGPYPCNEGNAERGCDLGALRGRIGAALAAGITPDRIVPVFQTFGQACTDRPDPYYRLPGVEEAAAMLAVWDELVPREERAFDVVYSWGPQASACPTLRMADGGDWPDLLGLYRDYLTGTQR